MRTDRAFNDGVTMQAPPAGRPPVRKILPELRRRKTVFSLEPVWYRRTLRRLMEDSQFLRTTVQAAFALLCVWIGIEFYLFARWGMSGGSGAFVARPPGAEGFLPISALISLKYFLLTGIINAVHPSGLFILLAILAVSLFLKKAFCSWLCPVGTLSESLWMIGRKLFRRNFTLPRWLDYPLRSLKYVILGFFVWSVAAMDVTDLANFIYSPYNKVADIKMYFFFAGIGGAALLTIAVLMLLSIVVKNFWCRFLCPYGALLGIASVLSPLKISVSDEGHGIPDGVRAHLFEPGQTGRAGGSGLGLAISRLLARQIGVTLALDSSGPGGTVFSLTLPVSRETPQTGGTG